MTEKIKDAVYYFKEGLRHNILNYSKAEEDYSKALELNPSYLDAYLRRGTLRYKVIKNLKEAEADFDKAVELAPECAEAYLHRGIVKCHLLKFDRALPDFNKSVELNPYDERALYNRGKNKFMLKYDEKEVREDLEKAVHLGSVEAADMIKLFYESEQNSVRKAIEEGIEKVRKQ
jgi:tetratricopeptide (TPR) repeat protein